MFELITRMSFVRHFMNCRPNIWHQSAWMPIQAILIRKRRPLIWQHCIFSSRNSIGGSCSCHLNAHTNTFLFSMFYLLEMVQKICYHSFCLHYCFVYAHLFYMSIGERFSKSYREKATTSTSWEICNLSPFGWANQPMVAKVLFAESVCGRQICCKLSKSPHWVVYIKSTYYSICIMCCESLDENKRTESGALWNAYFTELKMIYDDFCICV